MSREAQDLINDAGKTLGVLQSGETFNSDELNDGLVLLNFMLENWNTQGLEVFCVVNFQHALTASQTTPYTIGSGATFNTNRPVKIESANILQSSGQSSQLDIITSKQYSAILSKTDVSIVPTKLFCDNAYPSANIYLYPWASGTPTLDLWMWTELGDSFALTDTIAFPPGYYKALRYNLAVELLAMFPRQMDAGLQVVIDTAKETKAELQSLRATDVTATEYPPGAMPQPAPPSPAPTSK